MIRKTVAGAAAALILASMPVTAARADDGFDAGGGFDFSFFYGPIDAFYGAIDAFYGAIDAF